MAEDLERVNRLVQEALSDESRSAEAIDTLTRMSEESAGEVKKAARRALHRLASRGLKLEAASGSGQRVHQKTDDVYKVLASPIDGAGNRGIWFAFRRGTDIDFVSLLLNDEEGVKDAFARETSLGRWEREAKTVLGDEEFPWIEIPADYARHLVDLAHHLNATSGASLPLEYLAWREKISRPDAPYDRPIIYTVLNAAEVRWEPRHLDNSGKLMESVLFRGWILDKQELGDFVRDRLTAERSGLVLAGNAAGGREELIEDRAIQILFDARRRALVKFRLEEMAYVLWKLGRLEMARSALAAALALEQVDRPLTDHPFVREMVHWSLDIVTEMAREERTRSIRPGVQLHLP